MRPHDPPPPRYGFAFRNPPRSGNEINGLDESERRLATPVFHSTGRGAGRQPIAWSALDVFFNLIATPGPFLQVLRTLWQRRRYAGPVAPTRVPVDDPTAMTATIKAIARELGAGAVGVTTLEDDALYQDYPRPPYRFAISLATVMDREEMTHVPHERAAREVMRTYRRGSLIAIRLAERIRAMGWPAQAYADGEDLLQIPLAIRSGIGQLGKHGSLITREHGSNVRLAAVLTDLPLALDQPVDLAVDDLCLVCRRCAEDCPPGAIQHEKRLVRGVEKWYVDFDRCVPYFSVTQGCAICIEVCPWSEPGRGPVLSEGLLARREKDGR
ncbi:MAG: 4Fe-4S dicluster domain-containing protein [Gemmatimonadales bacterium]